MRHLSSAWTTAHGCEMRLKMDGSGRDVRGGHQGDVVAKRAVPSDDDALVLESRVVVGMSTLNATLSVPLAASITSATFHQPGCGKTMSSMRYRPPPTYRARGAVAEISPVAGDHDLTVKRAPDTLR
jgi:hypothetical protein